MIMLLSNTEPTHLSSPLLTFQGFIHFMTLWWEKFIKLISILIFQVDVRVKILLERMLNRVTESQHLSLN